VISREIYPKLYSAWVHPPTPVYMKLYVFNITNPQQIGLGELPKLEELGPFVFLKNTTKINISIDEQADTTTYKLYTSFEYLKDLSVNMSLQEEITFINVPFVVIK